VLYIRPLLTLDKNNLPSSETQKIDSLGLIFYEKRGDGFIYYLKRHPESYFIKDTRGPLKQYLFLSNQNPDLKAWGIASQNLIEYAKYIILHFPIHYLNNFMLPNSKFYFIPPLENADEYNQNKSTTTANETKWFNLPDRIYSINNDSQLFFWIIIPYLFLIVNVIYIISLSLILFTQKTMPGKPKRLALISLSIWSTHLFLTSSLYPDNIKNEAFSFIYMIVVSSSAISFYVHLKKYSVKKNLIYPLIITKPPNNK
jgi:hypothetical protein